MMSNGIHDRFGELPRPGDMGTELRMVERVDLAFQRMSVRPWTRSTTCMKRRRICRQQRSRPMSCSKPAMNASVAMPAAANTRDQLGGGCNRHAVSPESRHAECAEGHGRREHAREVHDQCHVAELAKPQQAGGNGQVVHFRVETVVAGIHSSQDQRHQRRIGLNQLLEFLQTGRVPRERRTICWAPTARLDMSLMRANNRFSAGPRPIGRLASKSRLLLAVCIVRRTSDSTDPKLNVQEAGYRHDGAIMFGVRAGSRHRGPCS